MRHCVRIGLFVLAIGLLGCATDETSQLTPSQKLVGVWRMKTPVENMVMLRKSDGSCLSKEWYFYYDGKPPAIVTGKGKWHLEGNYYIIELTETSDVAGAARKNDKPLKYEMRTITRNSFEYYAIGDDRPLVVERKIGADTDEAFNKAPLKKEFSVAEFGAQ